MTGLDISDVFTSVCEVFFSTTCSVYSSETQIIAGTTEPSRTPLAVKHADIPCSFSSKLLGRNSPIWELIENPKNLAILVIPNNDYDIKEKVDYIRVGDKYYDVKFIQPIEYVKSHQYIYLEKCNED